MRDLNLTDTTSFLNHTELVRKYCAEKDVTQNEPDRYLCSLERFGIICYKKLGDFNRCYAFAWQIITNSNLFTRFDKDARYFIKSLAKLESLDNWYRLAGLRLAEIGFEKLIKSHD